MEEILFEKIRYSLFDRNLLKHYKFSHEEVTEVMYYKPEIWNDWDSSIMGYI